VRLARRAVEVSGPPPAGPPSETVPGVIGPAKGDREGSVATGTRANPRAGPSPGWSARGPPFWGGAEAGGLKALAGQRECTRGALQGAIRPSRIAMRTRPATLLTSSLFMRCARCESTVRTARHSLAAISLLERPSAMS
jgi:hypothetical protein